jgi:ribonuclease R
MGDKLRIKVMGANLEKRQLDYEWVQEAAKSPVLKGVKAAKAKPTKKKKA